MINHEPIKKIFRFFKDSKHLINSESLDNIILVNTLNINVLNNY